MSTPALSFGADEFPQLRKRQLLYLVAAVLVLGAAPFLIWPSLAARLFSSRFLPHFYCYLGRPGLVWTHVIADALIALAYLAISATLVYLIYKARRDIPFHSLFLAFGLFIVACGSTHLIEAITVWIPVYVLSAGLKIFTAIASVTTAVVLPFTVPHILALVQNARATEVATDRLRLAMESGKSVGWDWDVRTGRDTWFGDLSTVFGIPSNIYSGYVEDFRRRLHPDDRDRIWKAVNDAMKNHGPYAEEFRIIRADGSVRWVAAKGKFYYVPSGEPKRMLGVASDITELKRAQEALRESEERLRLAAQAGKMFAYSWDAATDVIERSGESAKVIGIDEAAPVTGTQILASVHPDDLPTLKAAIAALHPDQPTLHVTYRMIRPDGTIIWVERSSRAYFDEHGKLARIVGMVADTTARKLAEEALAGISRRLIEAQESERARIARDLHDDIGQRLSLSAIMLDDLKRIARGSREKFHTCLTTLQKQLSEITTSVHTMSHGLHPSKLELLGLVAAMRACCNEISAQQKVDIQFSHRDVPHCVPRDVSLCLFRVLQEALHNAVKHSGVGEVGVELRGAPDSIDLIVRDGGIGFDALELIGAKGLGLTSMRERLKLVHGELSIDSQFHRGTRLHAHVPVPSNGNSVPEAG